MSRHNNRRRRPATKAPGRAATPRPPAGGKDVSEMVRYITATSNSGAGRDLDQFGRTLPFPADWATSPFGPGAPIPFGPIDGQREDGSGRPAPRTYQYPVQWNVFGTTRADRPVPWDVLEEAANAPLFRACIETRKSELATLDWVIRPSKTAVDRVARHSRRAQDDVAQELRQKYRDEIDRETAFWAYPDRRNGYSFSDWVALLMEGQLVWDAICVYPRRTYGGKLLDFMVIDGSTIKPLLDEQGGRPLPPHPAYQQILFGFPRGEFTADVEELADGTKVLTSGYKSDQLVYRRRTLRPRSPYGFPPTEQALLDGLLYNQRFRWMLGEYSENSMPAGWIENDGASGWSPRELLEYERAFNDRYAGQTAERFRQALLPPGLKPIIPQQVADRYKSDYDLHLIKLVAMHFGLTISELGFTESQGLGSTGYHEGQEDVLFRKQRLPDIRWYGDFVTDLGQRHRGMSSDLEFAFLALDQEDEAAEDTVWHNRVQSGRATLNEDRLRLGLPPYDFAEADEPMMETARGVVFLRDAKNLAPAGVLIEPASEHPTIEAGGALGTANAPSTPTARRPIGAANGAASKALDWAAIDAEIANCRRWLAKGQHARPFRFELVDLDVAAHRCEDLIMDSRVEFAKAGGSGPKASSPRSSNGPDGRKTFSSPPNMAPSSQQPSPGHSPYQVW